MYGKHLNQTTYRPMIGPVCATSSITLMCYVKCSTASRLRNITYAIGLATTYIGTIFLIGKGDYSEVQEVHSYQTRKARLKYAQVIMYTSMGQSNGLNESQFTCIAGG